MQECVSFSYQFASMKQAKEVSNFIVGWATENLSNSSWTDQLSNVNNKMLFVGNNAACDWFDFDGKISRLASVIAEQFPGVRFSGEHNFVNMTTGFEIEESFVCDGSVVSYTNILKCEYCGAKTKKHFEIGEMIFCNRSCAKSHLIDRLLDEDDFDEEELERKSCAKLLELLEDYE